MIKFNCTNLDSDIILSLIELKKDLSFEIDPFGINIIVTSNASHLKIELKNGSLTIQISKKVELYVAIRLLIQTYKGIDFVYTHKSQFNDLSYMLDCSRNAVPKVTTVEKLIRNLALMGYDSLQLYTEDTLEVINEPYFGYLRGRYSKEEIKKIDKYAIMFGIELVPCVQTLAHFNAITRWKEYNEAIDVNDILLVGANRTYALLDNIFKTVKECFTSKRINIGMDEAYMLGRGKYLEQNGYSERYPIMIQHLKRVNDMCHQYELEPMMWSDMFFALTFNNYYEENAELPQEIINEIPSNINIIYWDYYHTDYTTYNHMIKRHKHFNNKISFAGGAWKWIGFAPDNRYSMASAKAALKACIDHEISNVIVTGWGDNGGEASTFSTLPTLLYYSHVNYGSLEVDDAYKESFYTLTGVTFDTFMTLDLPNRLSHNDVVEEKNSSNRHFLYNDLLLGLLDTTVDQGYKDIYQQHTKKLLESQQMANKWGYLFHTLSALTKVLSMKVELGVELRAAYTSDDKLKLSEIIVQLEGLFDAIDVFYEAFYHQWHVENKPHGFDVQDLRIGGLKQRVLTAIRKIRDYIDGSLTEIGELEEVLLDYYGEKDKHQKLRDQCEYRYMSIATVNVNN